MLLSFYRVRAFLFHRKAVLKRLFSYETKNALCAGDAQLAERKLLLRSPLARGDCAERNLFYSQESNLSEKTILKEEILCIRRCQQILIL